MMTVQQCLQGRVVPFLKWPGGKRWLAPKIVEIIRPRLKGTYIEPFLGGGGVFFALQPERALLADINSDLISLYQQVKRDYKGIIRILKQIPVTKKAYNLLRATRSSNVLEQAAVFLFLNRTAFGGIYRLNKKGEFNVPFGGGDRTPDALWAKNLLAQASTALQSAEIQQKDFEATMLTAGAGDVIYCDPTYTVAHDRNGFVRYNESNFSWSDQIRLARVAREAVKRGVFVLISNAHHPSVRKLYPGAKAMSFERRSSVSPNPDKRRPVMEYLLVLNP